MASTPFPGLGHRALRGLRAAATSQATLVTGARLLQNGLGFALSLAILHRFGLPGVGLLTIASLAVVIQATLLAFGLPYVLAKSALSQPRRNALGAVVACGALLIGLPIGAALGVAFGRDAQEALVIALLSLGGAYFAQSALADTLLVLQARTAWTVLSPLGGLAGLALAYALADSYATFSAVLAAGRFAGVLAIFASMPLEWCGWTEVRGHLRDGFRYLVPDTVGLAADQMAVASVALFASRAELGVFGLCRQLLTASDTPMWSRLVVWYPQLCRTPRLALSLQVDMLKRGVLIAVALAVLSAALGRWVYRLDDVVRLAPLLMLCVPFRYVAGTGEFALRALGAMAAVNWFTAARCALVALLPIGIAGAGITGAVLAVIAQGVLVAALARHLVGRELAVLPAAAPGAIEVAR